MRVTILVSNDKEFGVMAPIGCGESIRVDKLAPLELTPLAGETKVVELLVVQCMDDWRLIASLSLALSSPKVGA